MRPSVQAVFQRGPRFFEQGDELMFEHVLDARSKIGPRPATEEDLHAHKEAFERMGEPPADPIGPRVVVTEEQPAEPVDRPYAKRRAAALKA